METEEIRSLMEGFKEKIFNSIKENLMFSIISIIWQNYLNTQMLTASERQEFQKNFIKNWKTNIINVTQKQLKDFNELLNNENIDIINIISGKNVSPDVEDYQKIINECVLEIEKIYWQLSEKEK